MSRTKLFIAYQHSKVEAPVLLGLTVDGTETKQKGYDDTYKTRQVVYNEVTHMPNKNSSLAHWIIITASIVDRPHHPLKGRQQLLHESILEETKRIAWHEDRETAKKSTLLRGPTFSKAPR